MPCGQECQIRRTERNLIKVIRGGISDHEVYVHIDQTGQAGVFREINDPPIACILIAGADGTNALAFDCDYLAL